MKKLLIAVSLLQAFVFGRIYAQHLSPQEIRRIIEDNTDEHVVLSKCILSLDENFLVAGSVSNAGFVAKLSACGDQLWTEFRELGTETTFNDLTELPGGEIVIVGSCKNCAPSDTTRKALVTKLSATGMVLLDTTFGLSNLDAAAWAVMATTSGKVALTGSFVHGSFLAPTNAFLAVLNENLQVDLWREFNTLYYDESRALTQSPDGGYVLAGYASASLFAPRQAQLYRTDAAGQLIWSHTSTQMHTSYGSVQVNSSGALAALGVHRVDTTLRKRDIYLVAYDLDDGSVLLERNYGSSADDEGRSLHVVEGGFLVGASWGEPSQQGWSTKDWVFRLDENYEITGEDFFDSYLFAHSLVNAVPLSQDGLDYAYLSTRVFFNNRNHLFYKKTRCGRHIQLSQAPLHYQLVPRNMETNMGVVTYAGAMQTPGAYDQIRLDVWRNNALWQSNLLADTDQFNFQVSVPAELASYTFHLYGVKNGMVHPEADACDVVAGDAYIIQGQSNAAAYPPFLSRDSSRLYYANRFVRNFGLISDSDTLFRWRREAEDDNIFADNSSGQWGLVLGARLVQEQNIPIAIINGGIGGISIDQMLPNPAAPHNLSHSYGRFYNRMIRSGLKDHVRAILFFQGETNALPAYNETVQSYQDKYLQLRDYWQSDYSYEREYLFQIRPGCWNGNFPVIQEAQRGLSQLIPGMRLMSSTGMNHDGCHYYFENGYERAGHDVYRLIAGDLYSVPELPNIHPPTVDSAWFSSCGMDQITLRLKHVSDNYTWTPGWESDFRLEGSPATHIDSGRVIENTIVLELSDSLPVGFTGLSYVSHAGGAEAPVKNANDIGMAAFYHMPVSMCPVGIPEAPERVQAAEVFPNPNSGRFVLRLQRASDVSIFTASGSLLEEGRFAPGDHHFYMQAPAGVYWLVLKQAEGLETLRIVKW